jgi:peptidoglycan/xylan/chitin deacetylase (PgdA/CDA1 family)
VRTIALTFDDGPDERWTPELLDLLAAVGAQATFFPIARRAAARPDLIKRMRDEGHTVGLHCDRHERHSSHTIEWLRRDTSSALERLRETGVRPALWRTPWGDTAPWTETVARERGLRVVGWTVDTIDWRGDTGEAMYEGTRDSINPGAIILAHDGLGPGARRSGAGETLRYVELLAEDAYSRGLTLEALD